MSDGLPQGWAVVQVQEVFHSFSGGTPSKANSAYWGGNIPWLSSGDIKSPQVETASETITRAGLDNSSARLCRTGSVVVVVRSGILKHTLPVAILAREAAINQDLKCFDSGDAAINQWLALSLRAAERDILALNREGTTVQSVKYETLKEHELSLPPLPEQRRIVAKLELLLDKVDTCRKRLEKIPVLLKRFRQSVLAAACSGRLTADWREENLKGQVGEDLLEKTLTTRRRLLEQVQAEKLGLSGRSSTVIKRRSNYSEPHPPNATDCPEIPEEWCWATVEQISVLVTDGDHNPPKRVSSGIPHLTAKSIKRWKISREGCTYIAVSDYEKTRARYEPVSGDVIVTCVGTLGETAVVPDGLTFSADRNLAAVRVIPNTYIPQVLQYVFNAPYWEPKLADSSGSSAQPHLYLNDLRSIPVPLMTVNEQHEIVRRVEALFALADQIETRYAKAKTHVDRLTQSILAKAFRGELVPQDPNDEPASVLLERIRAARQGVGAPRKKPRRRGVACSND